METDWDAELVSVQNRERENASNFDGVVIDSAMNYIGEWDVPGFTTSTGKFLDHNELWELLHSYKYMQKLASLKDRYGNCLVSNGAVKLGKCLELGCDWGHQFVTLRSCFEEVCGVEANSSSVDVAKIRGNNVVNCMMEHTPFEDGMFDLVISNQTLEHSLSADIVLREIYRVTKPGGHSIHTVPCWQSMHVEKVSTIHKTNLNYLQWIEKFKEYGFKIVNHFWGWNHNMEDWTVIAKKEVEL